MSELLLPLMEVVDIKLGTLLIFLISFYPLLTVYTLLCSKWERDSILLRLSHPLIHIANSVNDVITEINYRNCLNTHVDSYFRNNSTINHQIWNARKWLMVFFFFYFNYWIFFLFFYCKIIMSWYEIVRLHIDFSRHAHWKFENQETRYNLIHVYRR